MIKILKQSGHDFPGKRLCGGYYTQMLNGGYYGGQYSTQGHWFCVKASIRICYIILCECRSLKTDGLIFQGNAKYFTAQQILWCCIEKI